jgi:alkyl hydroperoxide reductase subunit AhpC
MPILRIGKPAPDLSVGAYIRGEPGPTTTSLSDYRNSWVVLVFYPRDFTVICSTELRRFAALEAEFGRHQAVLVAASTDSVYAHRTWFEGDPQLGGVAFPVLADTSHRLARAFGVLTEGGTPLRATFILDPAGLVRHVLINDLDVGRNPDETLRTLCALRTGAPCPVSWRPGEPTLRT